MNESSSMYAFAGDDYEAPTQRTPPPKTVKEPVIGEVNHQANRADGALKYENNKQFQQKADAAPVNSAPKTSALYEWGLILASRDSSNYIALKINKDFPRANIGVNFKAEKARYLAAYEAELMNGYK